MIIQAEMQKALNQQMNMELGAWYSYLAIAAHFDFNDFPGFARWFKAQANEEFSHAMKLNTYILARGGKIDYKAIEAPNHEWDSCLSVFEKAYAQELLVSASINDLMTLAKNKNDYATEALLQWFVTEQVEEEDVAKKNVEKYKFINNAAEGVIDFDKELGERK